MRSRGARDGLPHQEPGDRCAGPQGGGAEKIGLTDAVHAALAHELEREQGKPSLVELGVKFCRDLRARGNPAKGQPADKAFRDSLYEDA